MSTAIETKYNTHYVYSEFVQRKMETKIHAGRNSKGDEFKYWYGKQPF